MYSRQEIHYYELHLFLFCFSPQSSHAHLEYPDEVGSFLKTWTAILGISEVWVLREMCVAEKIRFWKLGKIK